MGQSFTITDGSPAVVAASVPSIKFTELATDILELIGVGSPGQAQASENVERVLRLFNDYIEAANLDRFNIYTVSSARYSFTPNQGSYQIGPGGADFPSADRPIRIDTAKVILAGSFPLTIPLSIWNDKQYADIRLKTLTITWPKGVYPDGGYPYQTLNFWPVPTFAHQFELWTWKQLQKIAWEDINSALVLPTGYARMLKYNVALEAFAMFQRPVNEAVAAFAQESKLAVQYNNAPAPIAELEGMGDGGDMISLDYLSGEPY